MLTAAVAALWLLFVFLTVLIVLLYRQFGLLYMGSRARVEQTGLEPGKRIPLGAPIKINGEASTLGAVVAAAEKTFLVFGGPGCELCARLIPQLEEFGAEQPGIGLVYVDRGLDPVLASEASSWRYAVSDEGRLHDSMDVVASPFGFVVDAAGVVLSKGIVNNARHLDDLVARAMAAENGVPRAVSAEAAPLSV